MQEQADLRPNRGWKAVEEALGLEPFPIDIEGVNYAVGDIEVSDGKGGTIPVRVLTDSINVRSFETLKDVMAELHSALKRYPFQPAA